MNEGTTTGPWRVGEPTKGFPHNVPIEPGVGLVYGLMGSDSAIRNARLMASAPDMLQALQLVQDWFDSYSGDPDDIVDVVKRVMETVAATLAKAKGE